MCPTCPSVPGVPAFSPSKAHLPTSAPLRVRPTGDPRVRYPASYAPAATWRDGHIASGFLLPFGHRHLLLGHPVPAKEFSSPHGRPTRRHLDPDGVSTFHTRKIQSGWAPSLSRDGGALPLGARPLTAPATSQRPVLRPAVASHPARLTVTRLHRGFTHVRPSGLLLVCGPRMEREPLDLPLRLHTPRLPATPARTGTSLEHWLGTTSSASAEPPV